MVKGILYKYLAKGVVLLVLGLVLFGIFPGTALAMVLALVVLLRFVDLFQQGITQCNSEENPADSAAPVARTVPRRTAHYRSIREIFADGLGIVAFALLLPLAFGLYTNEIFTLERQQSWREALIAVICLGLYAAPFILFKWPNQARLRIVWWTVPFFIGIYLVPHLVETRHPYLNPVNPDQHRLAAERVLSLTNNVISGHYAGWISCYAKDIETRGDTRQAIVLYQEALRREPNQPAAAQRLKALLAQNTGPTHLAEIPKPAPSCAPYWTSWNALPKAASHAIDQDLENVPGCTVIIIPTEGVNARMLDAIAYVVHNELTLPVYVAPNRIPLPPYSRKRGLATNPQWRTESLFSAMTNSVHYFPHAPVKLLIVTDADIYMDQSAYVVSQCFPWGAILSSARFGDPVQDLEGVAYRTAKQALCTMIKSFGVPPSTDPACVTSYSNGPQEFDAKGNRPTAETWDAFSKALAAVNQGWIVFKARIPTQP